MNRRLVFVLLFCLGTKTFTQDAHRQAARMGGSVEQGRAVFESKEASCSVCHRFELNADGQVPRLAGPNLHSIGDKFARDQLIKEILDPNSRMHPDFGTVTVVTVDGLTIEGVLQERTDDELVLLDSKSQPIRVKVSEIEQERKSDKSLMPEGLHKNVTPEQFRDLVAFLAARKQPVADNQHPGLVGDVPAIEHPIQLKPLVSHKFDFPVWAIAIPGTSTEFLVIEQKTRKIWRVDESQPERKPQLFVDLSGEATTGEFEGVMCLAFHPNFEQNRKYYVNFHVRNQGSHFSPIIGERLATADLKRDAGVSTRRLLQIPQPTDLHWGGMLAFGPDGYLYIGAGDAGPQEDPNGHGQNLGLLIGKILRIDVDGRTGDLPYAIPKSNPFANSNRDDVRKEIWAYGFRMPWRFSWDSETGDMWVGEIGQTLFEEVSMPRVGENHGWNVYEAFQPFSDRYRRPGEVYTPPVISYRRSMGVSVTGGHVYRGKRNDSYVGAYIFGDYESKRIWAAKQSNRKLQQMWQVGSSPERIASFGVDHQGEILLIGHDGTVFRVLLEDSELSND
ncbi:MAG: PQQ-dependent sugar dehydrogenase [Planctomycetales bacterium]|nr:PQQ-dependent sugar dehydrogenase [Planctomycetales bacterium]